MPVSTLFRVFHLANRWTAQPKSPSERQDLNLHYKNGGEACKLYPFELRSDMRHILKGASYFRIARPLRFQLSHSTGFLVTDRRRIRFTDNSWNLRLVIVLRHYPYNYMSAFWKLYQSGLTWEDTTAAEQQDLNLHQCGIEIRVTGPDPSSATYRQCDTVYNTAALPLSYAPHNADNWVVRGRHVIR